MKETMMNMFLFSALALLVGCMTGRPISDSGAAANEGQALGSFTIESRMFGNLTLAPTECRSGDHQVFLGADLSASGSPVVLRLVVDPLGDAAVRLYSAEDPFDKSVVFRRSDCPVFHFSLDGTGWRFNDFWDYRFTLQLDCAKEGETLKGTASSTHCH